jgi:hypothetical protein
VLFKTLTTFLIAKQAATVYIVLLIFEREER